MLSLLASGGTLVCCVLPAVMVAAGAGAALAGLVTAVPQLVWLSEHKGAVFGLAFALLVLSGALLCEHVRWPAPPIQRWREPADDCDTPASCCGPLPRPVRCWGPCSHSCCPRCNEGMEGGQARPPFFGESMTTRLQSRLTCPNCGHESVETMPTDACTHFHVCNGCGTTLSPKPGDCCVFCSYGSVPCPPIQQRASGGLPCCGSRSST